MWALSRGLPATIAVISVVPPIIVRRGAGHYPRYGCLRRGDSSAPHHFYFLGMKRHSRYPPGNSPRCGPLCLRSRMHGNGDCCVRIESRASHRSELSGTGNSLTCAGTAVGRAPYIRYGRNAAVAVRPPNLSILVPFPPGRYLFPFPDLASFTGTCLFLLTHMFSLQYSNTRQPRTRKATP